MTISKLTANIQPLDEVDKINEIIDGKQDTLVSGTNIKTINNNSILGSGNLTLDGLPSQTGHTGLYLQTDGTDASWQGVPGRNIGEIVASTIPLTDTGLHLLDGSLILGDGIYSAFVDYIADLYDSGDYTAIFDTEANWQTAVTTYGVCGKFVYTAASGNTAATVRLPKITGFIEGASGVANLGDLTEAGLPNITATWSGMVCNGYTTSGAVDKLTNLNGGVGGNNNYGYSFDASRSSSIYGNSSTVQPQSVKVLYYIVIATTTKTSIEVDIDEIATDLNGKADIDLSNVPSSKGILTESYVNGTSWYRVYSDGWCEQGGRCAASGNQTVNLLKQYADTNYQIIFSYIGANNTTGNVRDNSISSQSTNKFITSDMSRSGNINWQTTGYIR